MKSIAALVKTLNDPISRNDLVNMVMAQGIEKSPGKIIRHLMDNYKKYITKKNPIVFNFSSFANVVEDSAPAVALAYEVQHHQMTLEEETAEQLRGLDATKDPELNKFIRTDSYKELEELLEDGDPINIFISGESGVGKSSAVMMAAKKFNRPVVRVNFSHQTDFDDMMCSIRLKDDSTYVELGPVVIAALTGSILLLDECLAETEKVRIGTVDEWVGIPLSELEHNTIYPVVSLNMESGELENDFGSIISDRDDELFEVTLEDGRTIIVNNNHPFIIQRDGKLSTLSIADGLSVSNEIYSL